MGLMFFLGCKNHNKLIYRLYYPRLTEWEMNTTSKVREESSFSNENFDSFISYGDLNLVRVVSNQILVERKHQHSSLRIRTCHLNVGDGEECERDYSTSNMYYFCRSSYIIFDCNYSVSGGHSSHLSPPCTFPLGLICHSALIRRLIAEAAAAGVRWHALHFANKFMKIVRFNARFSLSSAFRFVFLEHRIKYMGMINTRCPYEYTVLITYYSTNINI